MHVTVYFHILTIFFWNGFNDYLKIHCVFTGNSLEPEYSTYFEVVQQSSFSTLFFSFLNLIFFKMIFSIFDCVYISNWKWCLNCSTCKLLSFQFWESLSYPCICKFSIFIENNAKMLHKFILWFTFYRAKKENGSTLNQQMVEVSNLEF